MENIVQTIHTRQERDMLVNELTMLKDSLYHVDQKNRENIRTSIRLKTMEAIDRLLQEKKANWEETDVVSTLLTEILEKVLKMQQMTVCIAFEPTADTISLLQNWAGETIKEAVLIDIQIDTRIIGGATIVYEGLYRSWTLQDKIEEYFAKEGIGEKPRN